MRTNIRQEKIGKTWSIAIRNEYFRMKHWHNEIEILFVLEGVTYVNIDGIKHAVNKNELLIISSGVVHCYEEPLDYNAIFVIRLTEDFMNCLSIDSRNFFTHFYADILCIRECEETMKIAEGMRKAFLVENEASIESILTGKFLELSAFLFENEEMIRCRKAVRRNNDSAVMDKMINYIKNHIQEKINLSDVAEYLGFSESYCSKYIKKKTNMNFLEYLNNERIEKAKTELRLTDESITEIAYLTGFTSIQSFNRVFKSFCEVSPTEYRKRLHDQK